MYFRPHSDLPNTRCLEDPVLSSGSGIRSYMTCQCREGYVLDLETEECVLGGHGVPVPCTVDGQCSDSVENAECFLLDEDGEEGDGGDFRMPGKD